MAGSSKTFIAQADQHKALGGLKRLLSRVAFLASAWVVPAALAANLDAPMSFKAFEPCLGNGAMCATQVLAQGTIQRDSAAKLERFLTRFEKEHGYRPRTVVFDSPGGDLSGGVELGSALRKMKMDTGLSPVYEGEERLPGAGNYRTVTLAKRPICASACVFAFVGGVNRYVEDGSLVGVHQFSGVVRDIGQSAAQQTVVGLAIYLESMGVSRIMLDVASLVPAASVKWLSAEEIRRFGLDTTKPPLQPWALSAGENGQLSIKVLQELASGRSIAIQIVREGYDRYAMYIMAFYSRAHYQDQMVTSRFPVGDRSKLELCDSTDCMKLRLIQGWKYRPMVEAHSYQTIALLSQADISRLSKASQLKLTDDQPMATIDLWLSTDLSTEGWRNGLSSLLRSR